MLYIRFMYSCVVILPCVRINDDADDDDKVDQMFAKP